MKEVILTPEGYEKLKQEIDFLQNDKRREVAERIRVAREFGDIAENAEYDDAKNEQAMLEHKIAQLEERLLSARVITKKEISKDTVSVGSSVRLRDVDANKTFEYHIVGSAEANPAREQALERVAGRQGDHRPQEGRRRRGRRPARRAQVQDPRDQGRLDLRPSSARRRSQRCRADRPASTSTSEPRRLGSRWSRSAAPDQLGEASAVLARAFHDDPAWRWVLPDPRRRAALLPWLFRHGLRDRRDADVWTTPGRVRGAARWLPPGRPALRLGRRCARSSRRRSASARRRRGSSPTAARSRTCAPAPRAARTGTSPGSASTRREQRKGVGAALLAAGPRGAARDGLPCVAARRTPSATSPSTAATASRSCSRTRRRRARRTPGRWSASRLDSRRRDRRSASPTGRPSREARRGGRAARGRRDRRRDASGSPGA